MSDWNTAKLEELKRWRELSGEEQDALIASGWHPGPVTKSPNRTITKQRPGVAGTTRAVDTTEVPVMSEKSLKVRVAYTTNCPEWWRIQIRKRLGRQGLATRQECVEWLRSYGTSEDDTLWLEWDAWQRAAEEGETFGASRGRA